MAPRWSAGNLGSGSSAWPGAQRCIDNELRRRYNHQRMELSCASFSLKCRESWRLNVSNFSAIFTPPSKALRQACSAHYMFRSLAGTRTLAKRKLVRSYDRGPGQGKARTEPRSRHVCLCLRHSGAHVTEASRSSAQRPSLPVRPAQVATNPGRIQKDNGARAVVSDIAKQRIPGACGPMNRATTNEDVDIFIGRTRATEWLCFAQASFPRPPEAREGGREIFVRSPGIHEQDCFLIRPQDLQRNLVVPAQELRVFLGVVRVPLRIGQAMDP